MKLRIAVLIAGLSACAAQRARGPLTIPLGLSTADTGRALRAFDFCRGDGARTDEELFPTCAHPGLGKGDAWVVAHYQGGVLVRLQRFERWADPAAARTRWDDLVGQRARTTPASDGARAQLAARAPIPDGTQAWVAFSTADQLVGLYLLSPTSPDQPAVLEDILPAIE